MVLGIRPGASVGQIKKAFRQKAKECHPDACGQSDAAQKFRLLREAYERLLACAQGHAGQDQNAAGFYNAPWRQSQTVVFFDYESWLKNCGDWESGLKLALFYCGKGRYDDAIAALKNLNLAFARFDFRNSLVFEDFMELGFVLAEQLAEKKEWYDAFILLDLLIRLESKTHYFKKFSAELMSLAKKILASRIDKKIPDELALDCWERALELGFSEKDNDLFKEKISLAYRRMEACYEK